MAQSAAELESRIADLHNQYGKLSREQSEAGDQEQKNNIADALSSIDYQISRLEEEWQEVRRLCRVARAGSHG